MPNFAEEEMEKWHKENNEPISQSDRSFYKSFGDQYLDDERRIRDQQCAEGAKEEARKWMEARKEERKHDEFIEYTEQENWDLRDYASMFWRGTPTSRRTKLRRNPDYVGPKKEAIEFQDNVNL